MTGRPSPVALPIEARREAWRRTWARLLAPPAEPEPPPADKEGAAGDEPAAREEAA